MAEAARIEADGEDVVIDVLTIMETEALERVGQSG